MESNTFLNEDPFHNEHTQRLFEAIDELRSCGADTDIGCLPELVIVGDQSVGKSSLLQSLTDISFPVASQLCTRFPTRIVSRRTPNDDENIRISIEPAAADSFGAFALKENRDEKAKRLNAYNDFAHSSPNMTLDEFTARAKQAQELMGIKHDVTTDNGVHTSGKRNFARDVLKVEISGPNRSYFSILDVPGVFQSLTKDLTLDEKVGVRDMVARYMQPQQSIIICVASGNNDLANQAAFDMASLHDLPLQRTVGVITKCDISQDKNQVLSLAQNKEKHLNHGWFVVRNRSPEEIESHISSAERHRREMTFFDSQPWTILPESRRGIQALKKYLADLLCKRIQETFPTIVDRIKHGQTATSAQVKKLGPARNTIELKRTYLTGIAQQFYGLTSQALRGRYHGLVDDTLKIRKHIREANDAFAFKMRLDGHCVAFQMAPFRLDERKHETPAHDKASDFPLTFAKTNEFTSGTGFWGGHSPQVAKVDVRLPAPSTKDLNFGAVQIPSSSGVDYHQQICMLKPYSDFSPEELRLSDYMQERSKPIDRGTGGGLFSSGFGSNARSGPPFFGATNQPPSGALNQPLFGATNQNPVEAFGQASSKASGGGLFGQPSTNATSGRQSSRSPTPETQVLAAWPNGRPNEIYTWIREEVNNCRGTELQGTLNPDVLPALFHRQIAKWKDLATTHFSKIAVTTGNAAMKALETTCKGDDIVAQKIRVQVRQVQHTTEAHSLQQIRQRVDEIASRHLQTQNPLFEEQIRKARLARFAAALERYRSKGPISTSQGGSTTEYEMVINLRDVAALFDQIHMSNAQNLEDDIHDILKSYYELALRDFIEYVNQQVVESYLRDPEGPVLFFNPTCVSQLSQESIEDLGAEEPQTVATRKELQETLERLNRAEKIARKYT
ncbi:MAG: hypothetical protein Q9209_005471 [Squamulea sp. 1 TL-2023]